MITHAQIGARILELRDQTKGFVVRRLRTGGITAAVRDEIGDITAVTEDVLGDVVETLWSKRSSWAALSAEEQRRWAFVVARNMTDRRLTAAREAPGRKARLAPVLDGLGERRCADQDRLTDLERLRLVIETEVGPGAWDQVLAAGLRNHQPGLRVELVRALEAVREGRPVVLKAIIRRCRVDWRIWAASRLEVGGRLCPARAVELGLFANAVDATSQLAMWWAEHRYAAGLPADAGAILASGIVDHLGSTPGLRAEAAGDLLVWINRESALAVAVAV